LRCRSNFCRRGHIGRVVGGWLQFGLYWRAGRVSDERNRLIPHVAVDGESFGRRNWRRFR
jgi:hypothetical protein